MIEKLLKGNSVRVLRQHKGYTVSQLAKLCSVTPGAISQIESGAKSPSVALLRKLAEALQCDMELLA